MTDLRLARARVKSFMTGVLWVLLLLVVPAIPGCLLWIYMPPTTFYEIFGWITISILAGLFVLSVIEEAVS